MKNPTDWDTRKIAPVNLFSTSIKVSKIKKIRLVNSQWRKVSSFYSAQWGYRAPMQFFFKKFDLL